MTPEAQRLLADLLGTLRTLHRQGSDDDLRSRLAHAGGALEALRAVGTLSDGESAEWMARMFEAAGIGGSPPSSPVAHPARPGEMSAEVVVSGVVIGNASTPAQSSRFWRLVPGPDREEPLAGGRLRIVALELFYDHVAVHWRLAPPPDPETLFSTELTALGRETECLPEWERTECRRSRGRRLLLRIAERFLVADDAGTTYRSAGGSSGGGEDELIGRQRFAPAVPEAATELDIGADGARFTVDVRSPAA